MTGWEQNLDVKKVFWGKKYIDKDAAIISKEIQNKIH